MPASLVVQDGDICHTDAGCSRSEILWRDLGLMSRAFRRARSYESKCRGPKLCSTRGWYTRSRRCMGEEIHSTQKPMPYNLQEERANCEDPLGCENPPVPRRELRQAITLSDSMSQKFMCTGRGVACPLKSCTHSPKESSDSTTRMPGGTTVDSFHACPMPHREPYTDSDEAPLAASAVRAIRIEATNVGATDCDRGDSNPQSFASISKKAEIDGNSGVVSEPPRWMPPAKSAQGSIVSLHPKSATSLSKTPRCSPVGRSATMNKVPSNLYHSGSSLLFRILKATERQKHKCLKLLNDRPLLIAFLPSFILALLPLIGTFCILAVGLLPVFGMVPFTCCTMFLLAKNEQKSQVPPSNALFLVPPTPGSFFSSRSRNAAFGQIFLPVLLLPFAVILPLAGFLFLLLLPLLIFVIPLATLCAVPVAIGTTFLILVTIFVVEKARGVSCS